MLMLELGAENYFFRYAGPAFPQQRLTYKQSVKISSEPMVCWGTTWPCDPNATLSRTRLCKRNWKEPCAAPRMFTLKQLKYPVPHPDTNASVSNILC